MFCQCVGVYEGIPMVPGLFSNAKNQKTFYKSLRNSMYFIFVGVVIYSPLAVLAYKNNI